MDSCRYLQDRGSKVVASAPPLFTFAHFAEDPERFLQVVSDGSPIEDPALRCFEVISESTALRPHPFELASITGVVEQPPLEIIVDLVLATFEQLKVSTEGCQLAIARRLSLPVRLVEGLRDRSGQILRDADGIDGGAKLTQDRALRNIHLANVSALSGRAVEGSNFRSAATGLPSATPKPPL